MRYKIVIIIIAMLLLNGLNNSREINDLAIVSAIGIDKVENGKYKVSAIVLNPEKQGSGSGTSSSDEMTLYENEDETIQTAIRRMILESPKKLYLAHMKLLLISESVAKDSLLDVIDFFIRDNEENNDFYLVVAKGVEPREVLQIKTPVEDIPSENIVKSIEATARYIGITTENELRDSIESILEEVEEVAIPSIILKKEEEEEEKDSSKENEKSSDEPQEDSNSSSDSGSESSEGSDSKKTQNKEKILVDSMAYFKDNKLAGYLDMTESMIYTVLNNKFVNGIIQVKGNDNLVAEIIKSKTKLTPKYENGKYIVDISLEAVCNVTEMGEKINFEKSESIHDYEKLLQEKLKADIQDYITKCQKVYNTDIIGFGKLYREKLNKEYKKIENVFYTDIFSNIETNIEVKVLFPNDGGINKKW